VKCTWCRYPIILHFHIPQRLSLSLSVFVSLALPRSSRDPDKHDKGCKSLRRGREAPTKVWLNIKPTTTTTTNNNNNKQQQQQQQQQQTTTTNNNNKQQQQQRQQKATTLTLMVMFLRMMCGSTTE